MFEDVKKFAIEKVMWAEKNLKGKTGQEKKQAVVKMIDDMIKLPAYLEWADDLIISWVVDKVCELLNTQTNHNFENLKMNDAQEKELASEIEIPEEML